MGQSFGENRILNMDRKFATYLTPLLEFEVSPFQYKYEESNIINKHYSDLDGSREINFTGKTEGQH